MNKEEKDVRNATLGMGLIGAGITIFVMEKFVLKLVQELFRYKLPLVGKLTLYGFIIMMCLGAARGIIIKQKAMENLAFKK